MRNSDLFLFMGKCLSMESNPSAREEVVNQITRGEIPWEKFVWMGSSHLVLPALYTLFQRNGLLSLIPVDLADHLHGVYALNLERNRKIRDQCLGIASLLSSRGIEPLFMKGAGFLLSGLYADEGDRIMQDVDILLPPGKAEEAWRSLSEAGYETYRHPEEDNAYGNHHHLSPLYAPGKPASVELHRSPVREQFGKLMSAGEMFSRAKRVGEDCLVSSLPDSQLMVFLRELVSSGRFLSSAGSMKSLCDFYLLAKLRRPDPGALPPGRIRKKYFCYGRIAAVVFNDPALFGVSSGVLYPLCWKKEAFLLNHPGWDEFWFKWIYTGFHFILLLFKAPFSDVSWRLLKRKVNNFFKRKGQKTCGDWNKTTDN